MIEELKKQNQALTIKNNNLKVAKDKQVLDQNDKQGVLEELKNVQQYLETERKRRREFEEQANRKDLEKKSLESKLSELNVSHKAELQEKIDEITNLQKAQEQTMDQMKQLQEQFSVANQKAVTFETELSSVQKSIAERIDELKTVEKEKDEALQSIKEKDMRIN